MRHITLRTLGSGLLGILVTLGSSVLCPAAFSVPPALQQAPEARIEQYNQTRAAFSLTDKIAAGKQRLEQRVAFKAMLARGMQVQAQERRAQLATHRAVLPAREAPDSESWGLAISSAVLAIVLLLALRMRAFALRNAAF